jgi:hypothetical protein
MRQLGPWRWCSTEKFRTYANHPSYLFYCGLAVAQMMAPGWPVENFAVERFY